MCLGRFIDEGLYFNIWLLSSHRIVLFKIIRITREWCIGYQGRRRPYQEYVIANQQANKHNQHNEQASESRLKHFRNIGDLE